MLDLILDFKIIQKMNKISLRILLILISTAMLTCNEDTVRPIPITSVTIVEPASTTLTVDQTLTLEVDVNPDNANNVIIAWKSSDEQVAMVDEKGKITAVNPGECIIIATAYNDIKSAVKNPKSASITITVQDKKQKVSQEVIDLVFGVGVFSEAQEWGRREEIVPGSQRSWTEQSNEPPAGITRLSNVDCFAYNTVWNCVTIRVSASQNSDNFAMFNPLASVLWPGNLVQGTSLVSGIPTSIPVSKRQPGNIALVSSGSGGTVMYRTVDKMQFSSVNQAMNDIVQGLDGQGFFQYSFEYHFIESAQELDFILNASFSGFGASAKAGFSLNTSEEYQTIVLVKLYKPNFTMVYDDPTGLDGVFTPDITVNDLRNYTGNSNPICYISSITYGSVIYVLYESKATKEELIEALNFSGKGFGVSLETRLKVEKTLEKTTVRIFQMGIGVEGGITVSMAVNWEDIQDFMEKGINFNSQNVGTPISYTVKYLKNAQLVRMNNILDYEVERCVSETTENECPELPQIITNTVTTFAATTATLGGNITNTGIPVYTERGVIYGTSPNRDNANNELKLIAGTGTTGIFSEIITGLTPGTTYYVWAYATNTEGTAFGEQVTFMTPPS